MIIKDIIDIPEDHKIQMIYQQGKGDSKAIIDINNNIIGYLWFSIKDKIMRLDMIEVIQKEEGFGSEAIKFLFKKYNLEEIYGQVLNESSMRPYYFWESLGAEFETVDEIDIERAYAENVDIYFSLKKTS